MKRKLLRVLEIASFIALLLLGVNRISLIKAAYCFEDNPGRSAVLFYELPKDTVDVVFFGDSHMFCGVIPKFIYDQEGISSASLATPKQFIKNTYWMLKEAVRRQDLKVVVIDIHSIEQSIRESVITSRFTTGLIMMPDFSLNKIRGFYDTKNTEIEGCSDITIDSVYSLTQFNSDFGRENSSIAKLIDYTIHPGNYYKTFGFSPQTGITPLEKLDDGITDDTSIHGTFVMEYLNKINDLCKENGAELLLVRFPFYSEAALKQVYQEIFTWADEIGAKTVDLFENFEEIGIDLSTDFRDNTHLNYNGAKKATDFFAEYLKNNYDLEDHRGDPKYAVWEDCDYSYEKAEQEMSENIRLSEN